MSEIYTLLLFAVVIFLLFLGVWKILAANREAKRVERVQAQMREQRKQELMDAVARAQKKKDDMAKARDAIYREPERAAEIIGKMMKK